MKKIKAKGHKQMQMKKSTHIEIDKGTAQGRGLYGTYDTWRQKRRILDTKIWFERVNILTFQKGDGRWYWKYDTQPLGKNPSWITEDHGPYLDRYSALQAAAVLEVMHRDKIKELED